MTKQVRKQEPTQKLELIDAEYEEDAFQDAGAMHDHEDADASEVSNDGSRPEDDVVDVQHFDRPVMELAAQRSKALYLKSSSKSSGPGVQKKPAGTVEGMCCRGAVCACREHMLSVRGPRVTWLDLIAEEAHTICMLPFYLVTCVRMLGGAAPDVQQKRGYWLSSLSLFSQVCDTMGHTWLDLCPLSRYIFLRSCFSCSIAMRHVLKWKQSHLGPRSQPARTPVVQTASSPMSGAFTIHAA
jgi:hypothetical protein